MPTQDTARPFAPEPKRGARTIKWSMYFNQEELDELARLVAASGEASRADVIRLAIRRLRESIEASAQSSSEASASLARSSTSAEAEA